MLPFLASLSLVYVFGLVLGMGIGFLVVIIKKQRSNAALERRIEGLQRDMRVRQWRLIVALKPPVTEEVDRAFDAAYEGSKPDHKGFYLEMVRQVLAVRREDSGL